MAADKLNQRGEPGSQVSADNPLFLRVERQSLRRLPLTRAVVFTIRVYVHPLRSVRSDPQVWQALLGAINQLSPAQRRYKGVDKIAPALQRMMPN